MEQRSTPRSLTLDQRKVTGLASVFFDPNDGGTAYDLGGGMREVIRPGAFAESLRQRPVVMLWNHDSSKPLASTATGTLKLTETADGLAFTADPIVDTSWGEDAVRAIASGLVPGCSFGFAPVSVRWEGDTRILEQVDLFEISVGVTFPAYQSTEAMVRERQRTNLDHFQARLDKILNG